jgi:cob(I)alamin adenosyltransferase
MRSRHHLSMKQIVEPPKSIGLIQVFTGNGKGKTTAALGTAIRAIARGWRVAFVYFDKGGNHYAERDFFDKYLPAPRSSSAAESEGGSHLVSVYATGLDRIDPVTNKFRFGVTDEDRAEGERGLGIVSDLFETGEYQLIVLDEINSTVDLGILDVDRVVDVIKQKPADLELILTGRNCPQAFIDLADLVSDVQLVKHYFYKGVPARDGLDF